MRLHEVSAEIEHLLGTQVDAETGEISDETLAALEALELTRERLALDLACYSLGLDAEADAIEARAKELHARGDRLHRKAASLLRVVESALPDGCKWSDDRVALSWRKNPPKVVVDDEEKLPREYVREDVKIVYLPDKKAIGEALKSGGGVEGAHLEQSRRLVVA